MSEDTKRKRKSTLVLQYVLGNVNKVLLSGYTDCILCLNFITDSCNYGRAFESCCKEPNVHWQRLCGVNV